MSSKFMIFLKSMLRTCMTFVLTIVAIIWGWGGAYCISFPSIPCWEFLPPMPFFLRPSLLSL